LDVAEKKGVAHLRVSINIALSNVRQINKINPVDDSAAQWVARINRCPLSAHEQAVFDDWLAADARHFGAFARMQAIFAATERAAALGSGLIADTPRPSPWLWGAAAAAASLLVLVSAVTYLGFTAKSGLTPADGPIAQAQAGRIDLPDGSRISLVEQARATTAFQRDARIVTLLGGKALFAVAKDPSRPFTVIAGDVRVTAIGTSFSVSRRGQRVEVRVIEGIVAVQRDGDSDAQRLVANQMASFNLFPTPTARMVEQKTVAALPAARTPQAESAAKPRAAMITFEAKPLGQAVLQFNAAANGKTIVVDPRLSDKPITGLFSSADPEGFAKAVAISMEARVRQDGADILIAP
jgi:transmembrane sensor